MIFVLLKDNIPLLRRPFWSSTLAHPLHQNSMYSSTWHRSSYHSLATSPPSTPKCSANFQMQHRKFCKSYWIKGKEILVVNRLTRGLSLSLIFLVRYFFHTPFLSNVDFVSVTLVVDEETRVSKDVATILERKEEFIVQVWFL